jgi:hypothetical protein
MAAAVAAAVVGADVSVLDPLEPEFAFELLPHAATATAEASITASSAAIFFTLTLLFIKRCGAIRGGLIGAAASFLPLA